MGVRGSSEQQCAFEEDTRGGLWFAGDSFVVLSWDSGSTFVNRAGNLAATGVSSLARAGGVLLVAAGNSGLQISADDGSTWSPTSIWQANDVFVNPAETILVATGYGLHTSRDNGSSWQLVDSTDGMLVKSVAEDPDGTICMIVPSQGVICSIDGGSTWYGDFPTQSWINVITVAADGAFLVGSGDPGAVHRSSDLGHTWVTIEIPFNVTELKTNAVGVVFAGGGVGGVAYSEDSGITWRLTETEPPSGSAALEIHPERGILAGGGSLWQSTDLGRTWRPFSDPREFEYHRCTDLLFDGGRLLSGTDDGGVFITEFPPFLRQTVVRSDE